MSREWKHGSDVHGAILDFMNELFEYDEVGDNYWLPGTGRDMSNWDGCVPGEKMGHIIQKVLWGEEL